MTDPTKQDFLRDAVKAYWAGYLDMSNIDQFNAQLAISMKRPVPSANWKWINAKARDLEEQYYRLKAESAT